MANKNRETSGSGRNEERSIGNQQKTTQTGGQNSGGQGRGKGDGNGGKTGKRKGGGDGRSKPS